MSLRGVVGIITLLLFVAAGSGVAGFLVRGCEVRDERERAEQFLEDYNKSQATIRELKKSLKVFEEEYRKFEAANRQLRETIDGLARYKREAEAGIDNSLWLLDRAINGVRSLETGFRGLQKIRGSQ